MKNVLTEEEIKELKSYQNDYNNLITDIGLVELQLLNLSWKKEEISSKIKSLTLVEKEIGNKLQNKYGDGTIDLEKGEFISV